MVQTHIAGVPTQEVIAFAELMNELEMQHVEMFGDSVNAAIVTNVKAADLKGRGVSIRGLARVIGLQPSTIRRRIANLVEHGWLVQDETGVHFPASARERGAPKVRSAMLRFAQALNKLGWGDFRPPP
jgi:lambda repressor-like predicted transcriptional regulator